MDEVNNSPSLYELLCLRGYYATPLDEHFSANTRAIIDWAEREVMQGVPSDNLLILASLSLDQEPEWREVEHYLERYMDEQALVYPKKIECHLVWLRFELEKVLSANGPQDIENKLYDFSRYYSLGEWGEFYNAAIEKGYWTYYSLFDGYYSEHETMASKKNEVEIKLYISSRLESFYRKLMQPSWIDYLVSVSKEGS